MCGIYLRISENSSNIQISEFDKNILEQLNSRGPDGTFSEKGHAGRFFFGFTRLAIRALETGDQPYFDTRFISVFNGEIYNTDVLSKKINDKFPKEKLPEGDMQLLGLWIYLFGPDSINSVTGMFAGYIKIDSKIYAFRDRVGEKPLYYGFYEDIFFISSLLPKIAYTNINLNSEVFMSGLLQNELSESISVLPPGTYIEIECSSEISKNSIIKHKYWEWPTRKTFLNGDKFKTFKQNTIEAIKSQLVSDVGMSVLLSGGIDSGIVAAIARNEIGPSLQAFTLSFKDSDYDEARNAAVSAKHLRMKHEIFDIDYEDLAQNVHPVLESMDIPIFDTGALSLFTLAKKVSNTHKVALTGDGGDELFRGYSLYSNVLMLNILSNLPLDKPISFLGKIIDRFHVNNGEYLGMDLKIQRALSVTSNRSVNSYYGAIGPFGGSALFDLICKRNYPNQEKYRKIITRNNMEKYFAEQVLPKIFLVKSDRMSMANGLELRAPFLDYNLIESAYDLSKFRISFKSKKANLKELGKEFLPTQILKQPKHGFSTPFHKVVKYLEIPDWKSHQDEEELSHYNKIWNNARNEIESASTPAWALLVKEHFFKKGLLLI